MEEASPQSLSSREIMRVARRRWKIVLVASAVGLLTGILVVLFLPRTWEGISELDIRTPSTQESSATQLLTTLAIQPDTFKHTQLMRLTNPWMMDQTAAVLERQDHIRIPHPSNRTAGWALSRVVTTKDVANSELIDIYADYSTPREAQTIANETALTFQKYVQRVDQDAAETAFQTMEERVKRAQVRMQDATRRLAEYEQQVGVINEQEYEKNRVDEESQLRLVVAQTERDLNSALAGSQVLRQNLQRQNALIRSQGERDNEVIPQLRANLLARQDELKNAERTYVNNPEVIIPLRGKVQDAQNALQAELNKVTNNSVSLTGQDTLIQQLNSSEQQVRSLVQQYHNAVNQVMGARRAIQNLPAVEREINELSNEATAALQVYQSTWETFAQIEMQYLSQPAIVQITGLSPIPLKPVSPSALVDIPAGLMLGLMVGVGLALLLERRRDSMYSEEEVHLLVPEARVLGAFPLLKEHDVEFVRRGIHPAASGPCQQLWTDIRFAHSGERHLSLVVTSTVQGEGKSYLAACLARIAADEGRRVILVDADLRQPAQHRLLGTQEGPGLCEAALRNAPLSIALFPVAGSPDLKLMPAGASRPDSPLSLFCSPRMPELLEELRAQADVLIFDLPPALAFSDARVLASLGIPILHVLEGGSASRTEVRRALQLLKAGGNEYLGTVLNKIAARERGYRDDYRPAQAPQNGAGPLQLRRKISALLKSRS